MSYAPQGQIDLSAILGGAAPQQAAVVPQVLPAQPEKKKPTVTAAEKRAAAMLDILQGKDTFGLAYDKLLIEMDPDSVQRLALHVKTVYGLV